jgi:hypothetical protein
MPPHKIRQDIEQIERIVHWLDSWRERRRSSMHPDSVHHGSNVTALHKPSFGSA